MPFYEYECSNCKFYTEMMQKISDAPLTKCPSCGRKTMVKLISAPNFRLKGSGWYETDFKDDKEKKRNLAGGDDEPSAKADEGSSGKGEEKSKAEGSSDSAKPESGKADGAKSEKAKSEPRTPASKTPSRPAAAQGKGSARPVKPPARAAATRSKNRAAPARARPKAKTARKKARR